VVEAHPYATAVGPDGSRYVADAAGNTLLKVSRANRIRTLAVLPPQPVTFTAEIVQAMNEAIREGNEANPDQPQVPLVPECVVGHVHVSSRCRPTSRWGRTAGST
jgi:hypothetical protein